MFEMESKYGPVKVYAETIEEEAIGQIAKMANSPLGKNAHIRIMPDAHAGAGCTIGTTMLLDQIVCPNLVGVDIGCGVTLVQAPINWKDVLPSLDKTIHTYIPSGFNVHEEEQGGFEFEDLRCWPHMDDKTKATARRAMGTLGGGNHFIEAYEDGWLSVHTGSRNIGLKVALYYQKLAEEKMGGKFDGLAYLIGQDMEDYLHDMNEIQIFASFNREAILSRIISRMYINGVRDRIDSVHNYIDVENRILRKGAISARTRERLVIPLNMRDGLLVCTGKGNEDWNYSAPHGAGRLYSRSRAKKEFTLEQFQESMKGIYTTTAVQSTIDEAPFAYKDYEEIMRAIKPTVDIVDRLIPIYNYKAAGD